MSPVAICGMPYSPEIRPAWVPLPAPCGPRRSRLSATALQALAEEALVAAHHHLRLHLAHRVERDAAAAQHRRTTAERPRRLLDVQVAEQQRRQRGDGGQGEGTWQREARKDEVKGRGRRGPGSDAGGVAALLAKVVGLVERVELNRGVEEREDNDQPDLDD